MNTLEQQTLRYWTLSSIWHKRIKMPVTTEDAIDSLTHIMNNNGPHRPIHQHTSALQMQIIIGDDADDHAQRA